MKPRVCASRPRSTLRSWLLRLAAGATATLVAFALVELLLHTLGVPRYGRSFPDGPHPARDTAAYVVPHPVLGWVSSPSIPGVNPQGYRDPRAYAARSRVGDGTRRVLVLGDSFVWGVGVSASETIPRLLEAELGPGFEAASVAVPGWGIDQMYLAYRQLVERLDPEQVILVFIDDDVDRVLEAYRPWEGLTKPCLVVRDGRLVERTSSAWWERTANKVLWRSVLFGNLLRHVFLYVDAVPVVRRIFATIAEEAAEHGRSFAIVRIPRREDPPRRPGHLRVDRFPGSTRVRYLDAGDRIRSEDGYEERLYAEDGHLSRAGNLVVARYLAHELSLAERAERPEGG